MDLLKKNCIPCEGGDIKPMDREKARDYLDETPDWTLDKDAKKISKEFKFRDFIGAINFVERVADIAEMEGHHPDIHIRYNKVLLELSTHAIGGLSENDFILAAKIDAHK
ncbi:4a-hydroxytetrahydrobiopterin dehydratase [Candidatus Nomurabacteria bacterium]|nr:4a-hydroxytetrahydrobiopterin dehydratase [Candidatus Nomurabacteria bacterium]